MQVIIKNDIKASSYLISYIDDLLRVHATTLKDLSFIAIDKGPGAFTSLRVSIATINGVGFARKIPLIGIDGLEAIYEEVAEKLQISTENPEIETVVCLLNAYNNDAYFYIKSLNASAEEKPLYGCKNIEELMVDIREFCGEKPFLCAGNGAVLYATQLREAFGSNQLFEDLVLEVSSAETIGLMACRQWSNQVEKSCKIIPNYIKTQNFAFKSAVVK